MLKHIFICEHCHKEMPYQLIRFNARVTCPHCQTKYFVSKSYLVYMIELCLLFLIGAVCNAVLIEAIDNSILRMVVLFIVILVIFMSFDIIVDKVFRYKKMFILMKRDK